MDDPEEICRHDLMEDEPKTGMQVYSYFLGDWSGEGSALDPFIGEVSLEPISEREAKGTIRD